QDAWATAPLPGPEPGVPGVSLAGGSSLVIFKDSPRADAAWKLVEFLSRPQQQARFYELTGDLTAHKTAWETTGIAADPRARAFRTQLLDSASVDILSAGFADGEYSEAQRLAPDHVRIGSAGASTGGELVLRSVGSDASAGAHITWPAWLGLSGFVSDSLLRGSVSAFPGFGFGGNGRITIGGRLVALQSDPGDGSGKVESTSADACISLNILGFSLVGALEDAFDDDDRRMSYGVVWVFSDGPPWAPQDGDGRGS
ncbi:MAG TPA: extracellular solute-binding protein, partial [Candidatus Fermentibacter sp.]|nr:extracellular solute-binding protein [Candidatus Fermentibacter sp.]